MTSTRPASNRPSQYRVQVRNRQRRFKIKAETVASFCAEILGRLKQPACRIGVWFVGPRSMRSYNRVHLGKDYATDVLSFPYDWSEEGLPFLGEIVIAPAAARDPMRKLLVHGMLHLLGYDHEIDGGKMLRLQARLLKEGTRKTRKNTENAEIL